MNHFSAVLARLHAAWLGAQAAWAAAAPAHARLNDLDEVLEHSADGVAQADAAGRITFLNPAALDLLGLPRGAAWATLQVADLAASGTRRHLLHTVLPALQARGVWLGEIRLRLGRQPGARRGVPFSLMALAHRDADGRVLRYSAVLRDISADVQARQQIQRQHDILSAITQALPATVVIVDAQGRYRFVNNAFERYVGLPADRIIGRTAVEVLGSEEVARRRPYMQRAVAARPARVAGAGRHRRAGLNQAPKKLPRARPTEPGASTAMNSTPVNAPAMWASWLMRPVRDRLAHTLNTRYSTANSGAGIGTGIGRMKIDEVGKTTIEANSTAQIAPDAPRLA